MKKKVLIFTEYFDPGVKGGGPIQSIKNLVNNLSSELEFYILTSDRDFGDDLPYKDIMVEKWIEGDNSKIYYIQKEKLTFKKIQSVISNGEYDYIYLNSFFSKKFSIIPIIASNLIRNNDLKIIVAPRGEFSPGAINLKRKKKQLYLKLAKKFLNYNNIIWHATSDLESYHISQNINNNIKIKIARNITSVSDINYKKNIKKEVNYVSLVFLSRVHPKKNLDKAISLLKLVKCNVKLDIYGPKEDINYYNYCMELIKELPENCEVNYMGVINNNNVKETFEKYHALFFPTKGENYGHVIAEALLGGCPIIISDQTPWRNLVEKKVGWDLPLNRDSEFVKAIHEISKMNQNEYYEISQRSFYYGIDKLTDPKISNENLELFKSN